MTTLAGMSRYLRAQSPIPAQCTTRGRGAPAQHWTSVCGDGGCTQGGVGGCTLGRVVPGTYTSSLPLEVARRRCLACRDRQASRGSPSSDSTRRTRIPSFRLNPSCLSEGLVFPRGGPGPGSGPSPPQSSSSVYMGSDTRVLSNLSSVLVHAHLGNPVDSSEEG